MTSDARYPFRLSSKVAQSQPYFRYFSLILRTRVMTFNVHYPFRRSSGESIRSA